MHVIGIADVDSFVVANPTQQADCVKAGYDLSTQIVSMRKIGDSLEVLSMPILVSDKESKLS
jgi:hypothetical protein